MTASEAIDVTLKILGGVAALGWLFKWAADGGFRRGKAELSKTEQEASKQRFENHLADLNVSDAINQRVDARMADIHRTLFESAEAFADTKQRLEKRIEEKDKKIKEHQLLEMELEREVKNLKEQVTSLQLQVTQLQKQINNK